MILSTCGVKQLPTSNGRPARGNSPPVPRPARCLNSGAGEKGSGDLFQGEDQPFNLMGEEGTDGEKVALVKAQADRDAAEARARQDREQNTLFAPEPEEEQPAAPLTERAKTAQAKLDRLLDIQTRQPLQPLQKALLARQREILAEEQAKSGTASVQLQTADPSKVASIKDLVSSATQGQAPARRQFTHYATVSATQAAKLKAGTGT